MVALGVGSGCFPSWYRNSNLSSRNHLFMMSGYFASPLTSRSKKNFCQSHRLFVRFPSVEPDKTLQIQAFDLNLGKDIFDDVSLFDAGEAKVEALELVTESVVIQAEQVQHGCMKVTHMHWIFYCVVS